MRNLNPFLRRLPMVFCFLLLGAAMPTLADDNRILELTDGSVISGQIISMKNGVYTVVSPTLGQLKVKQSEILSIRSGTASYRIMQASPQTPNGAQSAETLADIQNRIMAQPETLSLVMSLQQDPEVMAILSDPAIMQAIATRDMESLRNNPKIRQLESNETIRKILGRLNH